MILLRYLDRLLCRRLEAERKSLARRKPLKDLAAAHVALRKMRRPGEVRA